MSKSGGGRGDRTRRPHGGQGGLEGRWAAGLRPGEGCRSTARQRPPQSSARGRVAPPGPWGPDRTAPHWSFLQWDPRADNSETGHT